MLTIRNVNKQFDDTPVLNNVSLSVNKGDVIAIIGQSGGGKTTLMETLAAVISVAQKMTSRRSRRVSTPMLRASASLSVRRLMRQRSSSSGTRPMAVGMAKNATSRGLIDDKLPISQ